LHAGDGQPKAGGIGKAHLPGGHGIAVVQGDRKAAIYAGSSGDVIQGQGVPGGLGR